MATLVGGIIALILGIIGLSIWSDAFIILLQGGIPIVLILGGALATYLGVEEWKDSRAAQEPSFSAPTESEAEKYKAEAEKYRAELEALKKAKEETSSTEEGSGE